VVGTTRDPVTVRDQCTSSVFYTAPINAVLKFKYKPRVVDGEAVEASGVRNKFNYEIVE